jgi:Icc-related predicted phosphoesterase
MIFIILKGDLNMKLQILSDLHEEFLTDKESWLLNNLKVTGDVLLLAGDILTPSLKHRLVELSTKIKVPIYMVCGNHELYHGSWERSLKAYQQYFRPTSISVLENDWIFLSKKVRLIGATLWTDFLVPTAVGKEYQGGSCVQGMSDFALIYGLATHEWETRHKKSLNFIKFELAKPFDGKTVVMTHHAPSFKSNPMEYENSPIRGGFCSDLDKVIEKYQPDLWVHGHCHNSSDYKIGKTGVICNPKGYPQELNPKFNANLIVDI